MTEEQALTSNSQVISDQTSNLEQESVRVDNFKDDAHQKDIDQDVNNIQKEQLDAVKLQAKTLSEKPRLFSGMMFFVWIFSTLVFLLVTAGYIAKNNSFMALYH